MTTMKKMILTAMMIVMTISATAMSFKKARQQALFLTDKMAYELNLTPEQYDAAYEINLDYLMAVNHEDEVYGNYWQRRNADLQYILAAWQYASYLKANYFYRPMYWRDNVWHLTIYGRYTNRSHYYYARPTVYVKYRGGNNRIHGYYSSRNWHKPHQGVRVMTIKTKHGGYAHYDKHDKWNKHNYRAYGQAKKNKYDKAYRKFEKQVKKSHTHGQRGFGHGSHRDGRR